MVALPPGTLLQLLYLHERLQKVEPGRFIEIGPGAGEITSLLLDMGWSGSSYDLESKTIDSLKERFAREINEHRYKVENEDYLSRDVPAEKVDLVISCMVMEHLEDAAQVDYMKMSENCLKKNGVMIGLVPASPKHWGIEDDIAGHYRRYTRASLQTLVAGSGWKLNHVTGLTYPISNFLLPISNFLVSKNERSKLALPILERTKRSGRREVKFKTYFPSVLGLILNKHTLYPLHILQKLMSSSERALVLYFEAGPPGKGSEE